MTKSTRVLAGCLYLLFAAAAYAQTTTQVIAVTGDAAPDGNGTFSVFYAIGPAFNDNGQAVFFSNLAGTLDGVNDNSGIFLGDGTTLTQIAREGQNVPNGSIADFSYYTSLNVRRRIPALNNAGQVAFVTSLTGTPGGSSDDMGIYIGNGTTLNEVVHKGQLAPDADGLFSSLGDPSLNASGGTAFTSSLTGTGASPGVFFRNAGETVKQIARKGQTAPGGGTFSSFVAGAAINDAGEVAFSTGYSGGVYRSDGFFTLAQITGVPDGNGTLGGGNTPVFNNNREAAFLGVVSGTVGGFSDDEGVFRGDGIPGSSVIQIAREGQAAPGGNGTFGRFTMNPSLNDAGQVAFYGSFLGTSGGQSDNEGIFRGDGFTLIQIAREGQPVPDGNGVFNGVELGAPAINDLGQVAFYTSLSGTTGGYPNDDAAIFLYDDLLGLRQVVRRGDALLGSTITGLSFSSGNAPDGHERSGLNDLGQIAYGFTLADGRTGVASSGFAAITEPTALVNVTYDSPTITGPVSFGLTELPPAPSATFELGDGTPGGGGITDYGLDDVIAASLIFGDGIFATLDAFSMEVDAGGAIESLSYTFAPIDTLSVSGGIIVMNSPLFVTGTDIATGQAFSYTYANSTETFTIIPEPASLALLALGGIALIRRRKK